MFKFTHNFAGRQHNVTVWEPGHPVLTCTGPICGVDSETTLIQNRHTWPDVVVAGFSCNGEVHIVPWQHLAEYQRLLFEANPKTKFAFFNLSFDFNVMGKKAWLELLKQDNRILELSTSSKMFFAGTQGWIPGKVTLAYVAKHFLGVELNKEDGTRTSFTRETALTEQQICYLAEDCISTELCALQVNNLPTETLQARASFVLGEIGFNGMLVDRKHFDRIRGKILDLMGDNLKELRNFGYRVKQATEGMTQIQRISALVKRFGCGIDVPSLLESSGRSNFPTAALWIWAANILGLFNGADERTVGGAPVMPSDLKTTTEAIMTPALSPSVDWSAKNKVATNLKTAALESVRNYLDTFECGDCIGKSPKAEVALVILEVLLDSFEKNPDKVLELFKEEFAMRYDENLGWLAGTKPKKNTDLIQGRLKGLMAANPGLEFPLTESSAKNTKKYLAECAKKAKQPDPEKLSELAVYACKRSEMWRLSDLKIEDKFLELYTSYKHREKLLNTYLNPETIDSDGRWHTRFNDFLITGRTSSSGPNIQNIPKEVGLKENVIAPPGYVLCACDYSQEELITLAATLQHRYGKSRMADAINAGLDLHALFAAYRDGRLKDVPLDMLTDTQVVATLKPLLKQYKDDKTLKPKRQLAKSCNFGFGGGMGVDTFFLTVRNSGMFITKDEATQLREQWFDMWPEMKLYIDDLMVDKVVAEDYFDDSKGGSGDDVEEDAVYEPLTAIERKTITLYKTVNLAGIWRTGAGKQQALNFPFQSLAAVISKRAAWLVYLDSIENGWYRLINLIHDELLAEVLEEHAEEVALRIQRLMLQAGKEIVPKVKMAAEFGVMRRWSKAAEAEYVDGHLVPYDDVHPYNEKDEAF